MTADSQPAGSPLAPVHGSARGPSAAAVLLLVAAALVGAIAVSALTAPAPTPAPRPSAVALVSPSPAASPAPIPSPSVSPSAGLSDPGGTTVIVLRGLADPAATLGTLAGCSPLLRITGQGSPAIKGSDVDATAVAAGRETGWIFVPPGIQAVTRVWLGDDVVALARAAGRPVVAVGTNGDVWLGGPAGGARWRPIPTPAGRTAWVLTSDEVTSRGHCGPWPVPQGLAGQRSVTCAGVDAPTCLRLAAQVEADAPGFPYPEGDMALASPACPSRAPTCVNRELTAVAVPARPTGTVVGVRAAMLSAASGAFRPLEPGAEPGYALDAISRPSLPLAIGVAKPTPRACSATLTGGIRAAAWDPRVFWVGVTSVVWPIGTSARFADLPALMVPTADGSYRFVVGASVRLEGSVDPRTHAFVACSARPVSVAAETRRGP